MSLTPADLQLLNQCQTYDLAESQRLRRAQLALESGLPPGEFARPFPGNQVTITHNHAPEAPSVLKKLAPMVLAGLLGAGGAGALALATRVTPLVSPVSPPASTPTPAPASPGPLDLRVKWWVENGQIKTDVQPVGPTIPNSLPGPTPSPGGNK